MSDKPRVKVILEVEVMLDQGDGFGELENIGNRLADTLMSTYVGIDGEGWMVAGVKVESSPIICWYVPESKVYHTNVRCSALTRPDRYWPVTGATEPPKHRTQCYSCQLWERRGGT